MATSSSLDPLLEAGGLPAARQSQAVAGGDSGDSAKVILTDGRTVFVKRATQTPDDFFPAEARGLEALREAAPHDLLRVPEVYHAGPAGLVLEWLESAPRTADYWERFGRGLAVMHGKLQPHFGFDHDNYCGLTPQPNPKLDDGFEFFAVARLQHQGRLARDSGKLASAECRKLERLCERLEEWIPVQPPALIHGDLWSGNAHSGPRGEPVLIDPAAHYGWAEAELAMTTLFGRLPEPFYESYREHSHLAEDWEERAELYNLYHLLNHLNLFGASYLGSVKQVLSRWA